MKINLVILFGGYSTEHNISIISARSVVKNIDKNKYNIFLIGITRNRKWTLIEENEIENIDSVPEINQDLNISLNGTKPNIKTGDKEFQVDCVFPVLHGIGGEDGSIQGFLESLDIPYVGCDVESSSVCMNKSLTKRVLDSYGIKQVKYYNFDKHSYYQSKEMLIEYISNNFYLPMFIKPVHCGSSIGISKVKELNNLENALDSAFSYEREIIVEQGINGRDIECSVLGDYKTISASDIGEIIPKRDFYDYSAKYEDPSTLLKIPADISEKLKEEIRKISIQSFKVLRCYGMARVDFLLERNTNEIFLNEINTIPGFTSISMYPKLWECSGLSYTKLIDKLIELAFLRNKNYI